jgi:hypothetical protein
MESLLLALSLGLVHKHCVVGLGSWLLGTVLHSLGQALHNELLRDEIAGAGHSSWLTGRLSVVDRGVETLLADILDTDEDLVGLRDDHR